MLALLFPRHACFISFLLMHPVTFFFQFAVLAKLFSSTFLSWQHSVHLTLSRLHPLFITLSDIPSQFYSIGFTYPATPSTPSWPHPQMQPHLYPRLVVMWRCLTEAPRGYCAPLLLLFLFPFPFPFLFVLPRPGRWINLSRGKALGGRGTNANISAPLAFTLFFRAIFVAHVCVILSGIASFQDKQLFL